MLLRKPTFEKTGIAGGWLMMKMLMDGGLSDAIVRVSVVY